jgi:hypothetical protein
MIVAPEVAKPRVFKLVLAPSIVNPRVNRLWLVPSDYGRKSGVGASDFSGVVAKFRELFITDGSPYGKPLDLVFLRNWKEHCPDNELPWSHGTITVITDDDTCHTAYICGNWEPFDNQPTFFDIAALAGASLPNRMRDRTADSVRACLPNTALAWWVAVMCKYSTIRPRWKRKGETLFGPDDGPIIGLCWDDPILASLSAIESAGLIGPDPAKSITSQTDWSVPMSKTEFARRIMENPDARARDVDPIWDDFEKVQLGPNKWTFRLDTLSPDRRRKLEGGKQ